MQRRKDAGPAHTQQAYPRVAKSLCYTRRARYTRDGSATRDGSGRWRAAVAQRRRLQRRRLRPPVPPPEVAAQERETSAAVSMCTRCVRGLACACGSRVKAHIASPAVGLQPTADWPDMASLRKAEEPRWKDDQRPSVPSLSESMLPAGRRNCAANSCCCHRCCRC